ncbi:hypothetical protein BGZ50_001184, partial [Haplosporangium sp. Z 11]
MSPMRKQEELEEEEEEEEEEPLIRRRHKRYLNKEEEKEEEEEEEEEEPLVHRRHKRPLDEEDPLSQCKRQRQYSDKLLIAPTALSAALAASREVDDAVAHIASVQIDNPVWSELQMIGTSQVSPRTVPFGRSKVDTE